MPSHHPIIRVLVHCKKYQPQKLVHSLALYHPDFDDAYHYPTADEHGLVLVLSFDTDFDRTPLQRMTPKQAR
jgi:predicted nucleic acid-binding protein